MPLIVLNHQTNDLGPVTALEAGADGYIQLSCELSQLIFNVWSLKRRTGKQKSSSSDSEPLTGGPEA